MALASVGEGRGALVGGDHEIGIVAVVADDPLRRHDAFAVEIVGDVEEAARRRCGRPPSPRQGRRRGRRRPAGVFGTKPPLAPTGTITAFLTCCALTRPEHLGAEILRPVRPADAAARDPAEAQMHAFDARAVDEDLAERPRRAAGRRSVRESSLMAISSAGAPSSASWKKLVRTIAPIRLAKRRMMRSSSRLSTASSDGLDAPCSRSLGGVRVGSAGGEAVMEELDQRRGDRRMAVERRPHVVLRVGDAGLAEIAREGAQKRHVAPGEAGIQHQRVVAVALGAAVPDRHEACGEPLADGGEVDRPPAHAFRAPCRGGGSAARRPGCIS